MALQLREFIIQSAFVALGVIAGFEFYNAVREVQKRARLQALHNSTMQQLQASLSVIKSVEPIDHNSALLNHVFVLNNLDPSVIRDMIDYYPMTLCCGPNDMVVIVSNRTPGYDIRNRDFRIVQRRGVRVLREFPSKAEVDNLLKIITYAEIARGLEPHLQHLSYFYRSITTVRWSAIVTRLVEADQISVREANQLDDVTDSRIITFVCGTKVVEKPVDTLYGLDGVYEMILFNLFVNGNCDVSSVIDTSDDINISTQAQARSVLGDIAQSTCDTDNADAAYDVIHIDEVHIDEGDASIAAIGSAAL